ncbi:MAG: hypothetical protein NC340_03495 [Ruminococcus flavefaciens]|nr:hypothetical protein [Ruminococcus flavefaciens]MCM1229619.1 hypothetical protein [Ruminococcus flavefaciens]
MTLFEKITLFMFILMLIMCIAQAVEIIMWHKKIRKFSNRIKIRHKKTDSYIWMLVALANIAVESYMLIHSVPTYNYTISTDGYLYMILMWTAFLIYILLPTLFVRCHYITPEGLLVQGAKNDMYGKDEVKYALKGDTLELYYKKLSSAVKYGIAEKKDELTDMLSNNYKPKEKKQ